MDYSLPGSWNFLGKNAGVSNSESTAKAAQENSLDFPTNVALNDGTAVDYLVA